MRNPRIEELFAGLARSAGLRGLNRSLEQTAAAVEKPVRRLSGLTLTAKAAHAALLYRATGRPLVLVVDGSKQAEALFPAIATFCGLLEVTQPPLPVAAALTRVNPPEYYRQLTLTLRLHEEIPLDDLSSHLESIGYERHDPVEMAGEYSIRGGILDVFPPGQEEPLRIEFFGDEIESIRRFDPSSQRSTHKLTDCVLQPLTEFQKSRTMLAELSEHLREAGLRGVDLPASGEAFAGWETLAPALKPREATVFDIISNAIVVLDEPELTKAAADRLWPRLESMPDYANAEAGMIQWEPFLSMAHARDMVELRLIEIAAEDENSFHIATRPSLAFHGNLQCAINEAKTLIEAAAHLAFFAPTAGELER